MLEKLVMTVLILVTLGAFARRSRDLVGFLQLGTPDDRLPTHWGRAFKDQLVVVFGQRKLLQWTIPGVMHFFIFWGFVILFTTIVEAFGAIYQEGFHLPLIGRWGPLGALQDFFIVAVLVGIVMALAIRKIQRPGRFRGSHLKEADYILYAIASIMITILLGRAAEISVGHFPYDTRWTLVSAGASHLFDGLALATREAIDTIFLWWHSLIILGFLVYITYSKHLHIVTSGFNVLFTSERPKGALKPMHLDIENMSEDEAVGAGRVTDLTWKQLLDTFTCTECGRCQSQCPAWNTGKPLSPKLLIMDLRDHLFEQGPALLAAKRTGEEAFKELVGQLPALNPKVVEDEVIWDCTTCGACVQACPVNIEHIDTIVDMRRNLVMTESRFPKEMQSALQNMETTGNPWGSPPQARLEWMQGTSKQEALTIPHISEVPDADVLFWVGCAGAFDDRNKKVVYDFARLMQIAGVKFAVLGQDEACTGDPARRMGAEYIYQMLAEQNIEALKANKVKKIVTICPHCFNTIFNEYPQFGGQFEVVHHTEYLAELVREGRLQPKGAIEKTITYHDPCYNARHNDVWRGARDVIGAIPGTEYKEMHRHGHSTFCCGAGGGRMWMEERMGKKVNTERSDEALASASDTVAVGCPFCNIMLSDGVAERHAGERMQVRDVAQILLDSIEFHPNSTAAKTNGNGGEDGSGAPVSAYPNTGPTEEMSGHPAGPEDPGTT
ncbi:MAG: heterodisulfide reductase-related iron-sulfur binding cluster [Actinomycetota bacterium]|nr:heterodisulfide reductase-related iron-sulfur binding cluster [Actinomycetota bacterium]